MRWTVLRPRAFKSNTLSWAASIASASDRVVRALYGTSAHACGDPRDVAAVGVLAEDGHEGRVLTLTGPEPIGAVE
jgi:uncharacterized protein YbjT (DUF2867 family)